MINLVAYQCAWLACVLAAAAQRPVIGIAVAVAVVSWHLHTATSPWVELRLLAIATMVGATFESLLIASGWVRMEPSLLLGNFTPLWMVALWPVFATTLNVSLRALRPHYLLSALLAAIAAPLAYSAGAKLGALQWVNEVPALVVIAITWSMLMPLLMKSAQRFDGFATA
ncbi:MAG: DUF2878 domain-containing protein [Pseudomonadota bacterium]